MKILWKNQCTVTKRSPRRRAGRCFASKRRISRLVRSDRIVGATCVWCSTPPPKTRQSPAAITGRSSAMRAGNVLQGLRRQQIARFDARQLEARGIVSARRQRDPAGDHVQQAARALVRRLTKKVEGKGAVLMPGVRRVARRIARRRVLAANPALVDVAGQRVAEPGGAKRARFAAQQQVRDGHCVESGHRRKTQRRTLDVERFAVFVAAASPCRMRLDSLEPAASRGRTDRAVQQQHGRRAHHMPT